MIELKDVGAGYHGRTVLTGVSLAFLPGRITVLLGPNGCGKSTLLRTVLGLQPKICGEILVDGVPVERLSPRQMAQKAAYMPQSRAVPNITARRMVLHGRFPYLSYPRRYRPEDYAAVRLALTRADALDIADRPMQELSGGQRQKVYLAMALAQETRTILMDEPTAYLDARHQLDVMKTAQRLARRGKALVLVLHDLCLAMRVADDLAVLADGRIRQSGTPDAVYASGVLNEVFQIDLRRIRTDANEWQYYCA